MSLMCGVRAKSSTHSQLLTHAHVLHFIRIEALRQQPEVKKGHEHDNTCVWVSCECVCVWSKINERRRRQYLYTYNSMWSGWIEETRRRQQNWMCMHDAVAVAVATAAAHSISISIAPSELLWMHANHRQAHTFKLRYEIDTGQSDHTWAQAHCAASQLLQSFGMLYPHLNNEKKGTEKRMCILRAVLGQNIDAWRLAIARNWNSLTEYLIRSKNETKDNRLFWSFDSLSRWYSVLNGIHAHSAAAAVCVCSIYFSFNRWNQLNPRQFFLFITAVANGSFISVIHNCMSLHNLFPPVNWYLHWQRPQSHSRKLNCPQPSASLSIESHYNFLCRVHEMNGRRGESRRQTFKCESGRARETHTHTPSIALLNRIDIYQFRSCHLKMVNDDDGDDGKKEIRALTHNCMNNWVNNFNYNWPIRLQSGFLCVPFHFVRFIKFSFGRALGLTPAVLASESLHWRNYFTLLRLIVRLVDRFYTFICHELMAFAWFAYFPHFSLYSVSFGYASIIVINWKCEILALTLTQNGWLNEWEIRVFFFFNFLFIWNTNDNARNTRQIRG